MTPFRLLTRTHITARHCSNTAKGTGTQDPSPANQDALDELRAAHSSANEPPPLEFIQEEHENIPEPPESGRRLLRDAMVMGFITVLTAFAWTIYRKRRENYDDTTLTEVYGVRAHIQQAMQSPDLDLRTYHLNEAESHCRKALEKLGGGYLSTSQTPLQPSESKPQEYDPQVVALHVQLGKISYLLRKYQAAIDNYLVVLRALTQEFGYKSGELIMPCRQISDCYMNLGQLQMSALFLERALNVIAATKSEADMDRHDEYAPICQQMSVLLRKQGKWKDSIAYANKAIKGARRLLGERHIQIAHMLLGRACCEMELAQCETAEVTARHALAIVESTSRAYAPAAQVYEEEGSGAGAEERRLFDGGVKSSLMSSVKTGLLGAGKSVEEIKYEQEQEAQRKQQRLIANAVLPGVASTEQLVEMKCSILFVIGQALIEQQRLGEATLVFNNALRYATELSDTSKQLLIHDQLRDIQRIAESNNKDL